MSLFRRLYYVLPPSLRFVARRLYYLPIDVWETLSGRRDPLTPPRGMIYTGSGDFRAQGARMAAIFQQYAGLEPQHRVLDVGSGIGRIAAALTGVLKGGGSYEGFDVVKMGVRWCSRHITTRFPNFQFQFVPLGNDLYRSDGLSASRFTFPYPDADFDFVCVISVFTHLVPAEVERYLQEIRRVLRPGGRCCCTFFLLNAESERLSAGNPHFNFPHDYGHYRLMDARVQSANVAYREQWLREQCDRYGLELEPVQYGYWCGRAKESCIDFQDVVVIKCKE
jgi:SAM-dependent methyltransferase